METNITVPDFMPVLKRGRHISPADGACMMEYISVLAGERFSDRPACVHPVLAHMARAVNDYMRDSDEARGLLLPLLHRFMGTGDQLPRHIGIQLDDALARLEYDPAWSQTLFHGTPRKKVALLTEALDIYDRITGRQCPDPISDDRLRKATKSLEAPRWKGSTMSAATYGPTFTFTSSKAIWGSPKSQNLDAHIEAMLMDFAKKTVISA